MNNSFSLQLLTTEELIQFFVKQKAMNSCKSWCVGLACKDQFPDDESIQQGILSRIDNLCKDLFIHYRTRCPENAHQIFQALSTGDFQLCPLHQKKNCSKLDSKTILYVYAKD